MDSISKSNFDTHFGKILKEYRLKNNLTQEKLSEELDISLKYISRVENGSDGLKVLNILMAINILGIDPNLIFGPFITNKDIKNNVEIAQKISSLSDEKKKLASSIIDLLNKDF